MNIETGVREGDPALQKASALQTQKGDFQCIKINKITALQKSDFQILFQLILSKIVVLGHLQCVCVCVLPYFFEIVCFVQLLLFIWKNIVQFKTNCWLLSLDLLKV